MYIPDSFKERNKELLYEFIEKNNFGILFSNHAEKAHATHLPFLLNKKLWDHGTLISHFAKANTHWKEISDSKEILCVFYGSHGYISPSWYKKRDPVPTWNYSAIHIYGMPTIVENTNELAEMMTELTHYHESQIKTDWPMKKGEKKFNPFSK